MSQSAPDGSSPAPTSAANVSPSSPAAVPVASAAVVEPEEDSPALRIKTSSVDGASVCYALGNDVRWKIIKLLADGRPRAVQQIASALRRHPNAVGKHLQLMASSGVIVSQPGIDRRYVVYQVPEIFRNKQEPTLLKFGGASVRV